MGRQRCCKAFGRAFGRAFVEPRMELGAELLQSFCRDLERFGRARCFEVRHVDSATIYRAHFFLANQKLAWQGLNSWTREYRPLVPRVNDDTSKW